MQRVSVGLWCGGLIGILASPALANSRLAIGYDTSAFENLVLTQGAVSLKINYAPQDARNFSDRNLHYELSYQDEPRQTVETFTFSLAQFQLTDLDSDGTPEVVVQNYTGGAHCCTNYVVHHWDAAAQQFQALETGYLDGYGGEFEDLDGDGFSEFVSYDNAFLYAFGSYAESYPPSLIYTYGNGTLTNTTRNYPEPLQARADAMRQAFDQAERNGYRSNAILAGYVAQNSLLGTAAYEAAWQFMRDHYNPADDWGLSHLDDSGAVIQQYPDFPTALRAFLIQNSYLDEAGNPL